MFNSFVVVAYQALLHSLAIWTVWIASNNFVNDLKTDIDFDTTTKKSLEWPDVYKAYENIKGLCNCTNEAFKSLFTIYLANCMVAQAAMLHALLFVPDVMVKVRLVFIIFSSMLTFLLAADVNFKVNILCFPLNVLSIELIVPLFKLIDRHFETLAIEKPKSRPDSNRSA